jgi:hypothetical protein
MGRSCRLIPFAILALLLIGSFGPRGAEPAAAQAADPVVVGAGDIADCASTRDSDTAALLNVMAGTVLTFGDNVYENGTAAEFENCYQPTWGQHRARTRPSPGNHEYHSPGAAPYYAYFGANAGPAGLGYYSFNLGAWHVVSLNSNVASGAGSAQEQWLRQDLAANPAVCTLAYWHHPRFSSGPHGDNASLGAIWNALYEFGVDVVLNGHEHDYERFAPQAPSGQLDPARGIRQFVVGTGGRFLRPFSTVRANSEVRDSSTWGVIKLTLRPSSYDWEFVPIAGQTFRDAGRGDCVTASARPTATPTATPTPVPTAGPNVGTSVVYSGAGRLQVTITAQPVTCAPTNQLRSLQFGATTNGLVDIPGGQTGATGNFTITPPPGTQQLTFFVRQQAPGGYTTVPLVIVDNCGAWSTFVGGGPAAFVSTESGIGTSPMLEVPSSAVPTGTPSAVTRLLPASTPSATATATVANTTQGRTEVLGTPGGAPPASPPSPRGMAPAVDSRAVGGPLAPVPAAGPPWGVGFSPSALPPPLPWPPPPLVLLPLVPPAPPWLLPPALVPRFEPPPAHVVDAVPPPTATPRPEGGDAP